MSPQTALQRRNIALKRFVSYDACVDGPLGPETQKPPMGVGDPKAASGETANLEGGALPLFAAGYICCPKVGQGSSRWVLERPTDMGTNDDTHRPLNVRGWTIAEDANGNLRLDDLWAAAGQVKSRPTLWRITQGAKALLGALASKIGLGNQPSESLIYAQREATGDGTYAHPILAAAYAGYLSPELEREVRDVWLRYRAGDATLADDILQRASAEENHWAGVRALARSNRVKYTDVLKAHGVVDRGYMECTEATYECLLGGPSWKLREQRQLPKKANLRDHLNASELSFVMAAESLAAERIADEGRQGNRGCREATALGATAIRSAIEADRKSRQYQSGLRRM